MGAERQRKHKVMNWEVRAFYTAMRNAVEKKLDLSDKLLAVFEFFLPQFFVHDNNRGQFYSVLSATPVPGLIFSSNYEEIGDLPMKPQPPRKTPECGISLKCFYAMKQVCD